MMVYEYMKQCVMLVPTRTPDGEGGFTDTWQQGLSFEAAITTDTSTASRIAEQEGVRNVYTVTTDKQTKLDFHDVFKRTEDGQVFRVTSNHDDRQTPERASFQLYQVTAEEWRVPNDN